MQSDSDMNLWPSSVTMSYGDPGDGFDDFPPELLPTPMETICSMTSALLAMCVDVGDQQNAVVLWSPSSDGLAVTIRGPRDVIKRIEETRRGLGFSVMTATGDITCA